MRILVTGGAGFIGSHVADALVGAGHEVAIVDDLSSGRRENLPTGARFEQLDIRDAAAVSDLIQRFQPDVITHQAAQTSVSVSTREPIRDAEINILGTINLLDAAVRYEVRRFVFASTGGAIYGEVGEGHRAAIDWPAQPLSPYACSKLAGEHYLRIYQHEHGLPHTILRYANVYGPRQDPHGEAGVVAIFSQRLLSGQPLRINAMREPGDDGCIRDYVSVEDVVRANLAAVHGRIDVPVINICTGVPTSTRDIAAGLIAALDVQAQLEHGPRRPGDLERSVLDPDPALRRLGAVTGLGEGLCRTAHWFRERG